MVEQQRTGRVGDFRRRRCLRRDRCQLVLWVVWLCVAERCATGVFPAARQAGVAQL